jgi:hypothetical protein
MDQMKVVSVVSVLNFVQLLMKVNEYITVGEYYSCNNIYFMKVS